MTSVLKVIAGTPADMTKVGRYLGCHLFGGSAASSVFVYRGNANTDPLIGGAQANVSEEGHDMPPAGGVSLNDLQAGSPTNQLRVEVTGTAAVALIYFEPSAV